MIALSVVLVPFIENLLNSNRQYAIQKLIDYFDENFVENLSVNFIHFFNEKNALNHSFNNFNDMKYKTMPEVLKIEFVKLGVQKPTRKTPLSAGCNLYPINAIVVPPGSSKYIETSLRIQIPTGHYGRIAPKSKLASKYDIDIGAGIIDEDYRDEIRILVRNYSDDNFYTHPKRAIAQLICEKISYPRVEICTQLDKSDRPYDEIDN